PQNTLLYTGALQYGRYRRMDLPVARLWRCMGIDCHCKPIYRELVDIYQQHVPDGIWSLVLDDRIEKGALAASLHIGDSSCEECGLAYDRIGNSAIFATLDFPSPSLKDRPRRSEFSSLRASVKSDSEVGPADVPVRRATFARRLEFEGHGNASIRW